MCFFSSSVTELALLLLKLLIVSGVGYLVAPSPLHVSGSFLSAKWLLQSYLYRDICIYMAICINIERYTVDVFLSLG